MAMVKGFTDYGISVIIWYGLDISCLYGNFDMPDYTPDSIRKELALPVRVALRKLLHAADRLELLQKNGKYKHDVLFLTTKEGLKSIEEVKIFAKKVLLKVDMAESGTLRVRTAERAEMREARKKSTKKAPAKKSQKQGEMDSKK